MSHEARSSTLDTRYEVFTAPAIPCVSCKEMNQFMSWVGTTAALEETHHAVTPVESKNLPTSYSSRLNPSTESEPSNEVGAAASAGEAGAGADALAGRAKGHVCPLRGCPHLLHRCALRGTGACVNLAVFGSGSGAQGGASPSFGRLIEAR